MKKVDFGMLLVFFDILSFSILVLFHFFLERRNKQYISFFKQKAIQMDDYSIKVKTLPIPEHYYGDIQLLKALLLKHFNSIFEKETDKKIKS
jgi:hypothetical protein